LACCPPLICAGYASLVGESQSEWLLAHCRECVMERCGTVCAFCPAIGLAAVGEWL
jgi:hypothetical protein